MEFPNRYTRDGKSVRYTNIARGRVVLSFVLIGVCISVLLGRLVYLQVFDYSNLAARSSDNRVEIVPIAPVRGRIYDRDGGILAGNVTVYSLRIIPENVRDLEQLLSDVREIVPISEREEKAFRKSLRVNSKYDFHILKEYLDEQQVGQLAVERYRLPGVYIDTELHRNYYGGESVSHVVGRLSRIDEKDLEQISPTRYSGIQYIGKHGVEMFGEDLLVGWSGYERVEMNAHGQKVRSLSRVLPTSGENVYLTLDRELQQLAYDALEGKKGALVALDPSTGRVLAMVSRPSYDPNDFAVFSQSDNASELLRSEDSPLLNRAVQGIYPPGSTIKPFIKLVGLEYGHENLRIYCPGFYQLPGVKQKFRCWKKEGHGWTDYKKAIAESCDVFFYALALRLGIDRMSSFLSQFGFGQRTEVGLVYEKAGILPSKEWKKAALNQPWYRGETLFTGIGQSYTSVTMMQLAHATSIIANRGLIYKPQLIYKTVDLNTVQERVYEPELIGRVDVSKSRFESVVGDMVEAVHGKRGTARAIGKGATYTIAGKTGTVQVVSRPQNDEDWDEEQLAEKFQPHGVFVSFAPAENPQIVIAMVVENGKSGSAIAPIARQVMDAYLLNKDQKDSNDEIAFSNSVQ